MGQKATRDDLEVGILSRIPDDAPVYSMAVAERITSLTRRQIRYYEAMGLLRPARTPGNRRLYSPADLRRLVEVKRLLEEGLDLRAIAALAREGRLSTGDSASQPGGQRPGSWGAPAPGSFPKETGSRTKGLEIEGLGAFEDARAKLLGRGPRGSLDRLYPGDSGRFDTTRPGGQPASWLRLPIRPTGSSKPESGKLGSRK